MKLGFLRKTCLPLLFAVALAVSLCGNSTRAESSGKQKEPHPGPQATSSASSSTSQNSTKKRKSRRHYHREVGQKAPTPDRIKEIQSALSRDGYYQGDPNGKLDSTTVGALQKFQTDHGLDPSGKLDAATLQKMGLGSDIAGVSAPKPATPPSCCSTSGSTPAAGSASLNSPAHPAMSPSPASSTSLHAASSTSTGTTSSTTPAGGDSKPTGATSSASGNPSASSGTSSSPK